MEKIILLSVEILPGRGANVRWENRLELEGREPIVLNAIANSYMIEQREQFISGIENPERGGKAGDAAPYITALNW